MPSEDEVMSGTSEEDPEVGHPHHRYNFEGEVSEEALQMHIDEARR